MVRLPLPKLPSDFPQYRRYHVATVDANSIAAENGLGTATAPVVNTVILGAFSKVSGLVGLKAVIDGIQEYVPSKPEANAAAAKSAFEKANAEKSSE